MNVEIELNQEFTKEELESKFNTHFGSRIKGITLRRWEDGTPYILLFSRASGPYTDRIQGNVFYYDGEGLNRDQKLTTANKALMEANDTGRIIYGFRQDEPRGQWEYIGILRVLDFEYVRKRGYMTYEFRLEKTELDIPDNISPELAEITQLSVKETPVLTQETASSHISRKRRDAAFSQKVKHLYGYSCAVCGKKRFSNSNYPEVEASHIYPKEKNGSDDLRNGISLCKLHHWAFDGGLFTIADDYSIIVKDRVKKDRNYEEIYSFEHKKIRLPKERRFSPHPLFLKEHRKIHGFE